MLQLKLFKNNNANLCMQSVTILKSYLKYFKAKFCYIKEIFIFNIFMYALYENSKASAFFRLHVRNLYGIGHNGNINDKWIHVKLSQ